MWFTVFHHAFYQTIPEEIHAAIILQKEAKKARNDAATASFPLAHSFAKGEISKEEFISESFNLEREFLSYKKESTALLKNVQKLQSKHRTFGFDSYNIFSFQLSARIVLFLCIVLLIIAVRINEKSKLLLKVFNFASCNFLIICSFYTAWVFYKGNDFDYSLYITLAIVSGIITYLIINWIYKTIKQKKTKDQEFIQNAKLVMDILKQRVEEESQSSMSS